MSVWTNLRPAYAVMRPHEGGAETQAERYSQFFAAETQTRGLRRVELEAIKRQSRARLRQEGARDSLCRHAAF